MEVTDRSFPDWSMGFEKLDHAQVEAPGFTSILNAMAVTNQSQVQVDASALVGTMAAMIRLNTL